MLLTPLLSKETTKMAAKTSGKLEIHPFIQKRIERIKTAGKADAVEFKGAAIAFAEAQVEFDHAPAYYLENVRERVEALASARVDYLDRVRPSLMAFGTMLTGLPSLVLSILSLLISGLDSWGVGAWFMLFTVVLGLAGMHWGIGIGNCCMEVKKHKWRWIVGAGLYFLLIAAMSNQMTDTGDWSSYEQEATSAMSRY